jgi:ABC-type nitrate/sulfonate/bicarbonate transport system substrate-binding protein
MRASAFGELASSLLLGASAKEILHCMSKTKPAVPRLLTRSPPLRLGFLPQNDCAPLILAHEFGLFRQYGLSVELQSQASWKHIHDKVLHGELEAAQAPATLPFLINLGLTPEKRECLSGLVLSLQGSAITVSRQLWRAGVRDAASLRQRLFVDRNRRIYTFGVTCPLSVAYILLCQWLKSPASPPYTEVRLEAVPPEQLFPLLKLGYLDGYCAGEPWNSVAVQAGVGACIASGGTLAPLHPETVLMVRRDFADQRAEQHERLVAALLHACCLCDLGENRRLLCRLLAQPRFVNAPAECLEPGLVGPFEAEGAPVRSLYGLNVFSRCRANAPTAAKAGWLTGRLFAFLRWNRRPAGLKAVFRSDIFRRAQTRLPGKLAGSLAKDCPEPITPRKTGTEAVASGENWRRKTALEL